MEFSPIAGDSSYAGEPSGVSEDESRILLAQAPVGSQGENQPQGQSGPPTGVWRMRAATLAVFTLALAALVPTVGDFGLTWDEPAYRYSQVLSAQWWEELAQVRGLDQLETVFDPGTLLYYWPYGRYGINFHPPLAGQLNLASYAILGRWFADIPARRMASVLEFALTILIGFHFVARRYGVWVGFAMAGSLLFMPRLYGQAHLIDTDTPGLLLWAATALAFWKGLYEPAVRGWRIAVGVLIGLAFIEKLSARRRACAAFALDDRRARSEDHRSPGGRFDWVDGLLTTSAMLAPLAVAFEQILMLQQRLPPPILTDLFEVRPTGDWSGTILAVPLFVWLFRRLLARLFRKSRLWGTERPALETWSAILAFAPVVSWLGNPAWWREALPRLAHYYTLCNGRRGALPDIQIIYFGQVYEFSLPWHNGWVLMGVTVPVAVLGAAAIGLLWALGQIRKDRLPLYFLIHLLHAARHPNVRDTRSRRGSALPADVFLPGGVCRMGGDLVG